MKVYLSRSNAADPAVFSIVQQVIEDLGHDVVTFNGGVYSNKPLLECDALVVVPSANMLPKIERDATTTILIDDQPDLGKGQHQQCMEFARRHAVNMEDDGEDLSDIEMPCDKLMLIVLEVAISDPDCPGVYVNNITDVREQDSDDWKSRYGFLNMDTVYMNIARVLGRTRALSEAPTPERVLWPVSDSPMLGAATILGIL